MRTALLIACTLGLVAACGGAGDARSGGVLHIAFDGDPASPSYGTVEVSMAGGVLRALERRAEEDGGWSDVLAMYTADASRQAVPQPVLGEHEVADSRLRFVPGFPPVPGQDYRIHFEGPAGVVIDTVVTVTAAARPPSTRVVQIYPSADTLPENLLRLYIEFTAPMSTGEAMARVELLDGTGVRVEDAFLVTPEELWDPERKRLTLLFDPGRIKRDLRPNEELGPPLRAGHRYTLVVHDAWLDGKGVPLREGFRKSFVAGPADRTIPRAEEWRLNAPDATSKAPVVLEFPEPLDWGLLRRLLTVRDDGGAEVPGQVSTMSAERRWSFTPHDPWAAGDYAIEVYTELEDVAGNNLRAPFDVDRSAPRPEAPTSETIELPFQVR